jgi:hypothetical protein
MSGAQRKDVIEKKCGHHQHVDDSLSHENM